MKLYQKFISILLLLAGVFLANPAQAEEVHSSESQITVLPAKFELTSSQNQKIEQTLKIINDSDSDYLFAVSVDNVGITGENGEVTIGDNANNLSNLLSSWVKFDQNNGVLGAKSTQYIKFTVEIPESVEPGGKYASIVISSDKITRNAGDPQGSAKVVSLLMLTVAGDYEESAKIISFDTNSNTDGSYDIITRIRNQGIAHVKPEGSIVITNLFGAKISELTFDGDNVLPGSTRKTTTKWKPDKNLFGFYNATLVANYGKNNSLTITANKRFYSFPFWPTFISVTLFVVIFGWIIIFFIRKRRRGSS